ncbi:MAG: 5-formyltetrahydrofolate cyclo-ligase [Candidatus Dormibacteraeota bacterium]|nr:5-formyltetrahydrofolate cyclo-ligase [Candidatus Dormibacteraeota bacterium]
MTGDKQAVRAHVWSLLQRERAARFPGAEGRIPNFSGAERAASLLAATSEWRRAKTVKVNPDAPQLPVRVRALQEGKRLYMPVPRLADARPFLALDPSELDVPPRQAASIKGATRHGRPVGIDEMARIDLVVCGSVAVNRRGARLGKGGGFSDLEFALLTEAGLLPATAPLTTTVHALQILVGDLPETGHDFRLDVIVTPDAVLRCDEPRRPPGILWDDLDGEKIAAVPELTRRAPH